MTPITIALEDEQMELLRRAAEELGLSVEEAVRHSVDSYLQRREHFRRASDYVLEKNAELYRRLA